MPTPFPPRGSAPPLHVHTSCFLEPPCPHPAESQALLPSALSVPCKAALPPRKRPAPCILHSLPQALCTLAAGGPRESPSQQPFHTSHQLLHLKALGRDYGLSRPEGVRPRIQGAPQGTAKSVITGPLPPQSAQGKTYNLAEEVTLKYLEMIDQCNGDPGARPDSSEAGWGLLPREVARLEPELKVGTSCRRRAPCVTPGSWEGTGHRGVPGGPLSSTGVGRQGGDRAVGSRGRVPAWDRVGEVVAQGRTRSSWTTEDE